MKYEKILKKAFAANKGTTSTQGPVFKIMKGGSGGCIDIYPRDIQRLATEKLLTSSSQQSGYEEISSSLFVNDSVSNNSR